MQVISSPQSREIAVSILHLLANKEAEREHNGGSLSRERINYYDSNLRTLTKALDNATQAPVSNIIYSNNVAGIDKDNNESDFDKAFNAGAGVLTGGLTTVIGAILGVKPSGIVKWFWGLFHKKKKKLEAAV